MTIQQLIDENVFETVIVGEALERDITEVFCCDLLSVAMTKAPASGAWITVMGNMNMLAVAALTEVGCIILAEDACLDAMATNKAQMEGITVFRTDKAIFQTALVVHEML